jgi:hypothetical protein
VAEVVYAGGEAGNDTSDGVAAVYDVPLATYLANGVAYLVTSSFVSEARAVDPRREARRVDFNAALGQRATIVAQFRPYAGQTEPAFTYDQVYGPYWALDELERPGPTVTVYRLSR